MAYAKSEKTHRIIFEAFVDGELDDEGVSQKRWSEVRKAWASTESRSGAQKWQGGGYEASVVRLFKIDWIPGWKPSTSHRIKFQNELYDVESVDNIRGENLEYEIRATRHERAAGR